jgi:isochorismate synthase
MSIDDQILNEEYFAHIVLPSEFDSKRSPIHFEYSQGKFLSLETSAEFKVTPFDRNDGRNPQPATTKSEHEAAVSAALIAIESGEVEKVVISCIKHEVRNLQSLQSIFNRLIDHYPTACIFIMHHPDAGIWMGATPELLLRKEKSHYQTVSLAGTQPFDANVHLEWSEKLIHEQEIVSKFILNELEQCNAENITGDGPYTVQAGPLAHLKTDIRFTSNLDSESIIAHLQPTPAVCGMPREKARLFIANHSSHSRRIYAGCIGILLPNGQEFHFVALRCMQVFDDHFELHVGGGIVAHSIAEEEWNETEMKANVLRKLLK